MSSTQLLNLIEDSMEFSDEDVPNSLRRSVSSFDLNIVNQNNALREARSFTGALPELQTVDNRQITKQQHDPNYYMRMLSDSPGLTKESEYITKEISTDKIFVVRQEMLNYRGTQYSVNDIATRWKKDCRMWLWKNAMQRRDRKNRSVTDIRELVQTMRLPTSADSIKRLL